MSEPPLWSRALDRVFPFLLVLCAAQTKSDVARWFFLLVLVLWAFHAEMKKEDEE